jgi:LuxR family transcriptional regulator, regulator of acetate metabolism
MATWRTAPVKAAAAESLRHDEEAGFTAIGDVMVEAPEATSTPELARCAADLVVAVTGIDLSGVAMFDPGGGAQMLAASRNRGDEWEQLAVNPGDGVASRVLQLGGSVSLKNYALESGSSSRLIDVFAYQEGAFGMLAVPIQKDNSVVGIVYGGVRRPEYIGDRGRVGLYNLARLFAATIATEDAGGQDCDAKNDTAVTEAPAPPAGSCAERARLIDPSVAGTLSRRERRILELLSQGLSTAEVAKTEYLAINTVRSYIQSALWKLGANSRLQAVAIAREVGLIS